MQYRRKSDEVVIEAVQVIDEWFDGSHPNALHAAGTVIDPVRRVIEIPTSTGCSPGQVSDWLATELNGTQHFIRSGFFERLYEPIADA